MRERLLDRRRSFARDHVWSCGGAVHIQNRGKSDRINGIEQDSEKQILKILLILSI
jgi:hypothetical protein